MNEILEKEVEENILRNILLHELFISEENWTDEFFDKLHEYCIDVIINIYNQLYNKEIDVNKYYDMTISFPNDENNVKIVCNNIISALFFSNIFPSDNLDKIMLLNKYVFNKKLFTFNKKTKKLIITNL